MHTHIHARVRTDARKNKTKTQSHRGGRLVVDIYSETPNVKGLISCFPRDETTTDAEEQDYSGLLGHFLIWNDA